MKANKKKTDFGKIALRLLQDWKLIATWCGVCTVIGVCVALAKPHEYKVTAQIVPEQTSATGLASIASMMGVSMSGMEQNVDALDPSMFPMISESTPFLLVMEQVMVRTEQDTTLMTYEQYLKTRPLPWYFYVQNLPAILKAKFSKPKMIGVEAGDASESRIIYIDEEHMGRLVGIGRNLSVTQDRRTGVIQIKINATDPMVASMLTSAAIDELQRQLVIYKTHKANAELKDLLALEELRRTEYEQRQKAYADYMGSNRSANNYVITAEKDRLDAEMTLAYQALQQVCSQRYLAEQSIVERKPSYAMLQPPVYPILPADSRKLIVILWLLLGLIVPSVWILWIRDAITHTKMLWVKLRTKAARHPMTEE